MRPALLIVLMDFLVSSLLLFISGPERGNQGGVGQDPAGTAPEFSPAAVEALEAAWMEEYREQLSALRIASQDQKIKGLSTRVQDLAEKRTQLEQQAETVAGDLAATREQLARETEERDRLAQQAESLRQDLEARQAALQQRESELAERTALIASQQDAIAALTQQNQTLEDLSRQQSEVRTTLQDVQAGQTAIATNIAGVRQDTQSLQTQMTDLASSQQAQSEQAIQRLDAIAAHQSQLTGQLSQLTRSHEVTAATLGAFAETLNGLPTQLRAAAQGIIDRQTQLDQRLGHLAGSVEQLAASGVTNDITALLESMTQLASQQKQLAARVEEEEKAPPANADLEGLVRQQEEVEKALQDLAGRVEDLGTERPGPYRTFRDARVAVRVLLKERDTSGSSSWNPYHMYASTVFAPLVLHDGQPLVAIYYRDLGFEWFGISPDLVSVSYVASSRDAGNKTSRPLTRPLNVLNGDPRVLLIEMPRDIVPTGGLPLITRKALEERDAGTYHLFKRTSEGVSFQVEAALDMANPAYLLLKKPSRDWFAALQRPFVNPETQVEPGDFVVTDKGELVGVMVTRQRCYILASGDLKADQRSIPIQNPDNFRAVLKDHRQDIRNAID